MPKLIRDPLLSISRACILVVQILALIGAAVTLFAIPGVLILQDRVLEHIGPQAVDAPLVIWALAAILLLVTVTIVIGLVFLQELRRIIDTVQEGDPFVPINADRLRRMGWMALAAYGVAFLMAPFAIWLMSVTDKATMTMEGGSGFPFGGLILAFVLFTLARVFRKGSEMREELEGTV